MVQLLVGSEVEELDPVFAQDDDDFDGADDWKDDDDDDDWDDADDDDDDDDDWDDDDDDDEWEEEWEEELEGPEVDDRRSAKMWDEE
jgi:hypothetical protein